jgi:hypothetical protein
MKECQIKREPKKVAVIGEDGVITEVMVEGSVCKRLQAELGITMLISDKSCEHCTEEYYQNIKKMMQDAKQKKLQKIENEKKDIKDFGNKTKELYRKTIDLLRAGKRFVSDGLKLVDEQEFAERQLCCLVNCNSKNTCKYCGCVLGLKARMNSEKSCPNKTTYPNLKTYPPRNYWQVCKETTSIIISVAPNEKHLNQTLQSLLNNATGKIEILIGLDGWDTEVLADEKIKVIKSPQRIGRRRMSNRLVSESKGEYLLEIDAHCIISEGYDTKLKCSCLSDMIVGCTMSSINEEKWESNHNNWLGGFINKDLRWRWWNRLAYDKRQTEEEVFCFQSACWMIDRETFYKFGGHDEDLGNWGNEDLEWWLKIQCGGGKMVVRNDVHTAHLYRSKFPYPLQVNIKKDVEALRNRWNGSNPLQKLTIEQVVDKFRNKFGVLPSWDEINKVENIPGSILQADWDLILWFIRQNEIKKIIEFGAGQSTELFEKMGLNVISYETQQKYIDQSKAKNARFILWDLTVPVFPEGFNFVFIDGPFGGENREPAYRAAVQDGVQYIAAHDTNRAADMQWVNKYLKGWVKIAGNTRTSIFQRQQGCRI